MSQHRESRELSLLFGESVEITDFASENVWCFHCWSTQPNHTILYRLWVSLAWGENLLRNPIPFHTRSPNGFMQIQKSCDITSRYEAIVHPHLWSCPICAIQSRRAFLRSGSCAVVGSDAFWQQSHRYYYYWFDGGELRLNDFPDRRRWRLRTDSNLYLINLRDLQRSRSPGVVTWRWVGGGCVLSIFRCNKIIMKQMFWCARLLNSLRIMIVWECILLFGRFTSDGARPNLTSPNDKP